MVSQTTPSMIKGKVLSNFSPDSESSPSASLRLIPLYFAGCAKTRIASDVKVK